MELVNHIIVDTMKWINKPQDSIPYFSFENLENAGFVVHAFTSRIYKKNGKEDDFLQLLLRKDSVASDVEHCIRLMLEQFGTDADHLVPSAQKHTTNIHVVTDTDLGPKSSRAALSYVDGLVTDKPGVMLQTFGADCPSVYLADPVHRAIGLCHSGRKGTQNHIARVMLDVMRREFGTDPAQVLAAISPGICANCYEVGDDVAQEFIADFLHRLTGFPAENTNTAVIKPIDAPPADAGTGKPASRDFASDGSPADSHHADDNGCTNSNLSKDAFSESKTVSNTDFTNYFAIGMKHGVLHHFHGKYHINLACAIALSLQAGGVPAQNLETSDICTKCHSDRLYSFRGQGRIINENSAILMIKAK